MSRTRDEYDMKHKSRTDLVWQCSTCKKLECFNQKLPDDADHVTGCKDDVSVYPVKTSEPRCKRYKKKTYTGYSY